MMSSPKGDARLLPWIAAGHTNLTMATTTRDGNSPWNVRVLSRFETKMCLQQEGWSLEGFHEATAIRLDMSSLGALNTTRLNTNCYPLLETTCIFCDEVHLKL
jgi:hypothetical protein